MAESTCNESRSRRSVVRNRRSTRGHLCLDKEEEICEFITTVLSGEERLEILVQMCIKHVLESMLNDTNCSSKIPDKSLVQKSLMSVVDDLQNEKAFAKAVAPLKTVGPEPQVNHELEMTIKNAEDYISRMKIESREWECQLGRYENEAVSMERELEKFQCPDKKENANEKSQSCTDNVNYEERMKKIKALYETLQSQSKVINNAATTVKQFQDKIDEHLNNESTKLVSFFVRPQSTPLPELLLRSQPCDDTPNV